VSNDSTTAAKPGSKLVPAAGAVLWRGGEDAAGAAMTEVAVIHRPRYDDWSLPKGKVEFDESDPVAAVGDDFGPGIPLHTVSAWRQAVGARALDRLPAFLDTTRKQALPRVSRLHRIPGVTVFDDAPGQRGTWPFLLLTLPSQTQRDKALQTLWTAGLGVSRLFIHALPDYAYLRDIVADAPLPNARDFAARSLTITNSPWLDDGTFESICSVLEQAVHSR